MNGRQSPSYVLWFTVFMLALLTPPTAAKALYCWDVGDNYTQAIWVTWAAMLPASIALYFALRRHEPNHEGDAA